MGALLACNWSQDGNGVNGLAIKRTFSNTLFSMNVCTLMVTTISGADQNHAMKQSTIHTDFHEISMKSIWAKIYVLSEFALG